MHVPRIVRGADDAGYARGFSLLAGRKGLKITVFSYKTVQILYMR